MTESDKKQLLLVEDDPFLYKVLSERLLDEGIAVEVATDGEEVLKKAKKLQPSLILLDLILPKKSGFDVLKALREDKETKSMPVLVLSNLGQQEDIEQIKAMGIEDYLVKADYSLAEMVDQIIEHL